MCTLTYRDTCILLAQFPFFNEKICPRACSDLGQQPGRLVNQMKGSQQHNEAFYCSVDHRVAPLEQLNALIKGEHKLALRQEKWSLFQELCFRLPTIGQTIIFNCLSMKDSAVRVGVR